MQLHIPAVIIDNQLIHIGDDLLHLVHCEQKPVGGKEYEAIRKLLPAILMKLCHSRVQKGFIVSVKGQMALVAPIR